MSHEEIVATALYIVHRDDDIVGGDIMFKRAFHKDEARYIFSNVLQCRPPTQENIIQSGLMPLGKVETLAKRMIAFPNSHVHKVSTIRNVATSAATAAAAAQTTTDETAMDDDDNSVTSGVDKKQKRRIIAFFLINPDKRIVSTKEVPPQQSYAGGTMTYDDACVHRLELMKERKYTKQDWNVREIELCEH